MAFVKYLGTNIATNTELLSSVFFVNNVSSINAVMK